MLIKFYKIMLSTVRIDQRGIAEGGLFYRSKKLAIEEEEGKNSEHRFGSQRHQVKRHFL